MVVAGILSGLTGLLTDALQAVLDAFAALINDAIAVWPIGMPTLPTLPSEALTVFGWARWGPIGVVWDGFFALFVFLVGAYLYGSLLQPLLRYLKVWD
jgi:Co/Zn/Cd efflux system component